MRKGIFTFFLLFAFVCLGFQGYGQIHVSVAKKAGTSELGWQLLKDTSGIRIYCQYSECFTVEYLQFKVVNANKTQTKVTWNYRFVNNGQEVATNMDYKKSSVMLQAGDTRQSSCKERIPHLMILIKEKVNPAILTDIYLEDLKITN